MLAEVAELEAHRTMLTGHCYRMLGSIVDADDAVQETMVRAWKAMESFDGRSSVRTWLYRIATNVCIDALAARKRRERPIDSSERGTPEDELEIRAHSEWLEPVPDARVIPQGSDPSETLVLKQSIHLAFVAALQHLPAKQRACLLFTDVLGFSANEVAESLDTSVASVNSALQRARATLAERDLADRQGTLTEAERALVEQYTDAFERYDIDTLSTLLREDAVLSMPPFTLWLQGPEHIRFWMLKHDQCRGSKIVRLGACGMPAFAQYRRDPEGGYKAWAVVVLEASPQGMRSMTSFLDTEALFPKFGLELRLPA